MPDPYESTFEVRKQMQEQLLDFLASGVWADKGEYLSSYYDAHGQLDVSDTITVHLNGQPVQCAWKCERHYTGNFPLETWSAYPHKRGWLATIQEPVLIYLFGKTSKPKYPPTAHIFNVRELQRYAYRDLSTCAESASFAKHWEQTPNAKQGHITKFRLVPVSQLRRFVTIQSFGNEPLYGWTPWREVVPA